MRDRRPFFILSAIGALVCFLSSPPIFGPSAFCEPAGIEDSGSSPSRLNAAVLQSNYTLDRFKEKWRYEESVSKWQTVLSEMEITHASITDFELETGGLDEFTVLILPVAICLSEGERSAIRRFLSTGKGVVATRDVGARSESGESLGWGFLKELTGSKAADRLAEDSTFWVAFSGNSPLTTGLRPGFRMDIWSEDRMAVAVAPRDAYWSDWSLNPRRAARESDSNAAVAHRIWGEGRIAWFGFNVAEVDQDSLNQKALKRLMLNAVKWTGRIPMAQVWYWPNSHQAAAVFTQDVEYLFHNAASSVRVLRQEEIPGTFFCVSDLAVENQALVKAFTEVGEVGTHSDDHTQFKGQPFDLQLRRLKKSVADLKEMSGVEVKGLRPPYELYDEATLKAWAIVGGDYIFGEVGDYEPVVVPELATIEGNPSEGLSREDSLVIIRRNVRDDHMALVIDSLTDNEEILRLHKLDLDWIYSLSGLYMFPYHSNLYCLPERVEILAGMAKYAKSLDLWLATAGDVSRWWKTRGKISAEIHSISNSRLLLSVENRNSEPVADLSVNVYLPSPPRTVEMKSGFPHIPPPQHKLEQSKLVVYPDTLEPHSMQTYTITLQ